MSTGTDIIQRALQKIGVFSVASPPAPEDILVGFETLNSMLEMWLSRNIQIGFTPLEEPGSELNEPPDTRNGIISNLALELAPNWDNGKGIVSRELQVLAALQFVQIKNLYQQLTIPDKVVSSTLPVGQGNMRGYSRRVFFPKGSTING